MTGPGRGRQRIRPNESAAAEKGSNRKMNGPAPNRPRLPLCALTEFTQEMLVGLRAGLPIGDALAVLGDRARSRRLRRAVGRVRDALRQGGGLADALAASGGAFPLSWTSRVRVAERAGGLADMVRHLWQECRRDERLRATVRDTAAYPLAIFWATLAVVGAIVLVLLPRMVRAIAANGSPLPDLTLTIASGAALVRHHAILFAGAGVLCLWWQACLLYCAGLHWRGWWVLGRVVPFAEYHRQANAATFLATAGILLRQGLSDGEVLDLAGEAVAGGEAQRDVAAARQAVQAGRSLADAVGLLGFLAAETRALLRVAASGPALVQAMEDQARLCEGRMEGTGRRVRPLLEPILVVLVGLAIGEAVMAIYLPLFNLGPPREETGSPRAAKVSAQVEKPDSHH